MDRTFDGDPNMPLLWYVRDILQLTGTKFGCGIALCGAGTVHENSEAIRSCITPMSSAADSDIRTIESLPLLFLRLLWTAFCVPPGPCAYWSHNSKCIRISLQEETGHLPCDVSISTRVLNRGHSGQREPATRIRARSGKWQASCNYGAGGCCSFNACRA